MDTLTTIIDAPAKLDLDIGSMTVITKGTYNHAELNNLDYENSGHTGFASSQELANLREYVDSKSTNVYKYKGTVNNYTDLPTSANNGDVYNVVNGYGLYPAGTNYAWNGSAWDALGGALDLRDYSTTEEMQSYVTTQINTTLGGLEDELRGI